jgi:hypothetical protein
MPRKAKYVSMDAKKRFRITAELDAVTCALVEQFITGHRIMGRTLSISQIVRAGIEHLQKTGEWKYLRPETLQSVRTRQQLRAHTKPTTPTNNEQ